MINWPFVVASLLMGINLVLLVIPTALVHVCVGYLSRPHLIIMLGVTAAAVTIARFQNIWLPLLGLFVFLNLVPLAYWALIRLGVIDLDREDAHKSTPEYQFYFNSDIGCDVKLLRMLTGPGCGMRIMRLQFWVIIVAAQVIAFFIFTARQYLQK